MKPKNYILRVLKNGLGVHRVETHSIRLFLHQLRTIKWQDGGIKTYLRVYYGKHLDNFGKISEFHNDGWYESKPELWLALNAFREEV